MNDTNGCVVSYVLYCELHIADKNSIWECVKWRDDCPSPEIISPLAPFSDLEGNKRWGREVAQSWAEDKKDTEGGKWQTLPCRSLLGWDFTEVTSGPILVEELRNSLVFSKLSALFACFFIASLFHTLFDSHPLLFFQISTRSRSSYGEILLWTWTFLKWVFFFQNSVKHIMASTFPFSWKWPNFQLPLIRNHRNWRGQQGYWWIYRWNETS